MSQSKSKKRDVSTSFFFLITLLILNSSTTSAQQPKLDSLKQIILYQKEDSSKVDNLLELSFKHHQIDVNLCRDYAEQALKIAKRLGLDKREVKAYSRLGIAAAIRGNSSLAIEYMEKSLQISRLNKYDKGIITALHNLGIIYRKKGELEKALHYFLAALKEVERKKDIEATINTYTNIGKIHLAMKNPKLAYQYFQRAIKAAEQINKPSKLTEPFQLMGKYHLYNKEYELALPYLKKSYKIGKENAQYLYVATTLILLGECEYQLGFKEKAINSLREAETLLINIGEQQTELHTLHLSLSNIFNELGKYDQALAKAHKSLDLATNKGLEVSKLSSFQLLAQLYENKGAYKKALDYNKAATAQQDSLHIEKKEELIIELETKYQSEKKEIENELLRTQQEKSEAELKTKNALMTAIGFSVVLLGSLVFLLFRAYQTKHRYNKELQVQVAERTQELEYSNQQLRQSNMELERFAFIASHDLKTPLGNIINFTNLLDRILESNDNKQVQQCIHFIKEGGKRMNNLIEDVLEYSKLSNTTKENKQEQINLNILCEELANTISIYLEDKNAKIEIPQQLPIVTANYSSLFLLFKNLIENAIKYNESTTPTIKISFTQYTDTFSLFFIDNGIGIPEEFFDKIWDMFSRLHTHSKYEGTGLGLATCKKLIHTLKGTIHVKSTVGVGSIFEIRLPSSCLVV